MVKKAAETATPTAPPTRVVHRNAQTGRIATAEEVAARPKDHAETVLDPSYTATVVNVAQRASGVRVTLDLDMEPTLADVLQHAGTKVRVSLSV